MYQFKQSIKRVTAKFVPKLFLDNQKENRKQIAIDVVEYTKSYKNVLKSIIPGIKFWLRSRNKGTITAVEGS